MPTGAGAGAGAGVEEGEEEVLEEPIEIELEPQQAFVLIDGHASEHIELVATSLEEAGRKEFPNGHGGTCIPGLKVVKEFRLQLNKTEAKRILVAAKEVLEAEAKLAAEEAEAAADPKAKKGKQKTPRKEEKQSEEAGEAGAAGGEDGEEVVARRAFDPIVRKEEIKSLTTDRCTVLIVEGLRAVAVVDEVMGPGNPDEWEDFRECVRARVGGDDEYNLLHIGINDDHAAVCIDILNDIHEQHSALSEDHGGRAVKKSPWVDLDELYTFMFPPEQQHPSSTGRLILFGEYGPFHEDGTLRAGWRGRHVVTDLEIDTMTAEIERQDLLAIFVKEKGLPEEEKRDILKGADESKNKLPNMSRPQVEGMFKHLRTNSEGKVNFHELQQLIKGARYRRMQEMKKMYPDLTSSTDTTPAIRPAPPATGRFTKLGRKSGPVKMKPGPVSRKIYDNEAFKVVTKFLNTQSHKICDISDVNNASVTQNVRLLRAEPDPSCVGWDDVCCMRGTQRGSFVNANKKKK